MTANKENNNSNINNIPRVVIEDTLHGTVYRLLEYLADKPQTFVRVVVNLLINEGKQFSKTRQGRQIAKNLGQSMLYKNGKVLWTIAGLDEYLVAKGLKENEFELLIGEIAKGVTNLPIEDFVMFILEEYAKSAAKGDSQTTSI